MGLTVQGFSPKTLLEIRDDISDNLKIELGTDIDTTPSSRIGQFVDIISNEIYSAWLGLQDTYNSFYPSTSSGASLDNVVAITNTIREAAKSSAASMYFIGQVPSTTILAGSLVQKDGTEERLATIEQDIISLDANMVLAEAPAASGSCTCNWDGESITAIAHDDDIVVIKSKVEGHSNISDVTITGTLNTVGGFHILFNSESLSNNLVNVVSQDLANGVPLTAVGYFSVESAVAVSAVNTGALTIPALSIQTIATPIIGLDKVINFDIGITGTERETDAALRARREVDLQKSGTTTLGGMREAVEEVDNVTNVTIVENDTSSVDGDGRPPHSVEVFVTAPDDTFTRDTVAQAIYDTKPIGIGVVTTVAGPDQRVGTITDVNSVVTTLTYSSPDSIAINLEITLTLSSEGTAYPSDGDSQVRDALVLYFATLELGNDVKNHALFSPINTVPGIETMVILQSLKPAAPSVSTNIAIAVTEVAIIEVPAADIVIIS